MKTTEKFNPWFGVLTLFAVCLSFSLLGQTVSDIDGRTYKTVQIGKLIWMAENLSVTRFRNGDSIPQAKTPEEWKQAGLAGKPAWCYYDNNDSIGKLYGKLYNWYALTDPRGLAPEGWRVPTNTDWTATTKFLGGVDVAGMKLKDSSGWDKRGKGDNRTRFTARPGGIRPDDGKFSGINSAGQWWSASETIRDKTSVYSMKLQNYYVEVFYESLKKGSGLSVRAVRN